MAKADAMSAGTPAYGWTRPTGLTPSERHVTSLCDSSFFSLWSYANPFRRPGQELCDVLVVFEENLVLFSVKDIKIDPTLSEPVAWGRWYNNAVKESVRDLVGAQRWVANFPQEAFLDERCTRRLPVELPIPPEARYFRIVVALGSSNRIRASRSGLKSLRIRPDIVGDEHLPWKNKSFQPFAVGQVNAKAGYSHIWDDESLKAVLEELDTISDFLNYLKAKEALISNGDLKGAASELDLLADYLYPVRGKDGFAFSLPKSDRQ